jgi:hypothetical protein
MKPTLKLGKAQAQRDPRNLMLGAVLRAAPKPPPAYDFDAKHPGIPVPMFANDQWGCCVISGGAHQVLRFELLEQRQLLSITDEEVVSEYLSQTQGQDSGLYVLESLKLWRKRGRLFAARLHHIKAFAEVDPAYREPICNAICANVGIGVGLSLPLSAERQFYSGRRWSVAHGKEATKGGWGGHYVYVNGYNSTGPICITWGKKQQMTWGFFKRYCDEAYAIFDASNLQSPAVDSAAIAEFLKGVTPVPGAA